MKVGLLLYAPDVENNVPLINKTFAVEVIFMKTCPLFFNVHVQKYFWRSILHHFDAILLPISPQHFRPSSDICRSYIWHLPVTYIWKSWSSKLPGELARMAWWRLRQHAWGHKLQSLEFLEFQFGTSSWNWTSHWSLFCGASWHGNQDGNILEMVTVTNWHSHWNWTTTFVT